MNEISDKQPLPLWSLDGTGREDRFKGLPAPDDLKVDDEGLMQRLARAHAYASQIAFVGPDNKQNGNWEGMFLADPSSLLAVIAGVPLTHMAKSTSVGLHPLSGERGWMLAVKTAELAELLNRWYGFLLICRGEATFALLHTLSGLIKDCLGKGLAELQLAEVRLRRELSERDPLIQAEAYHRIWDLEARALDQLKSGRSRNALVDPALFHLFYNAAILVQKEAARHFDPSLETGDHDPAMGLFMAFLTLYQRARDVLNRLPVRHRDLYYNRVLNIHERAGKAGKIHLHFLSDGRKPKVQLAADTAFAGGKESLGRDVTARLFAPVTVHQGAITRVETLLCERHPLISPERELGLVSGLRHGVRILSPEIPEGGVKCEKSWPLFGLSHRSDDDCAGGDATLGFAIAAPIFAMAEGERRIQITLEHEPLEANDEKRFEETLISLARSRKEGRKGALKALFSRAFLFSISTEEGWHQMSEVTLSAALVNGTPRIIARLGIGREVPAVVGADPEIHGEHVPKTGMKPILKVTLNPHTPVHLTSLLSPLVVRRMIVRASVRGARNLTLASQLGPLDPNTPFAPFGPLPKMGSYWVIGHRESAGKQVKKCVLKVNWADLPTTSQGFAEHYRVYDHGIDNDSFAVSLETLKEGQWVAESNREKHVLFGDEPGMGERPAAKTRLTITDPRLLEAAPIKEGDSSFSPASRNGFFKVTLSGPEIAFGHHIYPELLTRRLMLQAKVKKGVELPNAPYTPMVSSVEMDYDAVETLEPAKSKGAGHFYHLLPSGYDRPDAKDEGKEIHLIPDLEGEAHLYLGISGGTPSGHTNLLFCLQEGGATPGDHPEIGITWAVLTGGEWKPLAPDAVLNDTTGGFLTTGIVSLNLPPTPLGSPQTQMPQGYLWLRATAFLKDDRQSPEALQQVLSTTLARCRGVFLNGAIAGLETAGEAPSDGTPFKSQLPLPGLKSATQAMASFGGATEESVEKRIARTRERLKHKGRAVTPWDMERILLEEEPSLRKVKCFPSMDRDGNLKPGHCLLAVLPEKGASQSPPRLSAHRLGALKQKISEVSSGHARFEVINPAYERIQVRCTLTLASSEGEALTRVHRTIDDFLSPWVAEVGYGPRFGWCVREAEVRAHIAVHPDVLSVTNFSMLHLIRTPDGRFILKDTALIESGETPEANKAPCRGTKEKIQFFTRKEIHPHLPWSIAIPAGAHFLEISDTATPIAPEKTGIGELEVGRTLIL